MFSIVPMSEPPQQCALSGYSTTCAPTASIRRSSVCGRSGSSNVPYGRTTWQP